MQDLTKIFDSNPEIDFWFYHMPNTLFANTTLNASKLQELIQDKFGKAPNLFIIEITKGTDYSGWIPQEHFQYFK